MFLVFGNMNITYAPLSPPLSVSPKRERELSLEREAIIQI
jgi:hypothetical protein